MTNLEFIQKNVNLREIAQVLVGVATCIYIDTENDFSENHVRYWKTTDGELFDYTYGYEDAIEHQINWLSDDYNPDLYASIDVDNILPQDLWISGTDFE